MKWEIFLERTGQASTSTEYRAEVSKLKHLFERNQTYNFKAKTRTSEPEALGQGLYKQKVKIVVEKERVHNRQSTQTNFNNVLTKLREKASKLEWEVKLGTMPYVEGVEVPPEPEKVEPLAEYIDYSLSSFILPPLTEETYETDFNGIYQREPHIRVFHDAVGDFLKDNANNRNHILLYGDPSSCKTTLMERFKVFYEKPENFTNEPSEVIRFLDKTTMSKAGLENMLIDMIRSKTLPKILAIEELEKGEMSNLNCLLTVMGSGMMMKNNARIGDFKGECPLMIMASTNDEKFIKDFQRGALWSRFSIRLFNEVPDRILMTKILRDKVVKQGGDLRWVDKAITFAYDTWLAKFGVEYDLGNPRGIKSLLAGRNRLLDGSYQDDLIEIENSKKKKVVEIKEKV